MTGILGDGRPIPPHDEFYKELTTRNGPLVTPEEQERIRTATILVAGCGSVGGAAIEPLIRLGCEHLILAEPDGYDVANMNRQSCRLQDVGKNKAGGLRRADEGDQPVGDLRGARPRDHRGERQGRHVARRR